MGIFYSQGWVALIRVHTCFKLRAFYMPRLSWYMSAFLLHSSARLQASSPLCVQRRNCYDFFFYGHDDIISLEFTVSSYHRHRCHDHACPFTSPFTSSVMGHRWHRNSWMIYIYTKLLIITALISPLSENAPIILMLRR